MKPIKTAILSAFSLILFMTAFAYGITIITNLVDNTGYNMTFVTIETVTAMGEEIELVKFDYASYIDQLTNHFKTILLPLVQKFSPFELTNQMYLTSLQRYENDPIILQALLYIVRALATVYNMIAFIVNLILLVFKFINIVTIDYPLALLGINLNNFWVTQILLWIHNNVWLNYAYI